MIDTETTGLSPRFNKVLTVGMLLVDIEKDFLKILDSNHFLVKHDCYNANPDALKINGINLEKHHKIAEPPKKVCEKINKFIDEKSLHKTKIVGHNFHFDKGFLNCLFNQGKSIPKFHSEHEDTMYLWRNLQKSGSVPFHLRSNLQTLAEFFRIDYTKAHDALADCEITARVYHKMLRFNEK